MQVKLGKLGIVMLGVSEMARSVAFYRDALGLRVIFESPEFTLLDAGGVQLALRRSALKAEEDELRTELVFPVEDVTTAFESLRGRGVTFRLAPRAVAGENFAADFRDPDGHVLSIFGPKKT
jgi:catechol 2,3-dioxygenase-like lactoylglutathione lyase family enzyme